MHCIGGSVLFQGELAADCVSDALHAARRVDDVRLIAKSPELEGNIAFMQATIQQPARAIANAWILSKREGSWVELRGETKRRTHLCAHR
jgi:hypothetical protein